MAFFPKLSYFNMPEIEIPRDPFTQLPVEGTLYHRVHVQQTPSYVPHFQVQIQPQFPPEPPRHFARKTLPPIPGNPMSYKYDYVTCILLTHEPRTRNVQVVLPVDHHGNISLVTRSVAGKNLMQVHGSMEECVRSFGAESRIDRAKISYMDHYEKTSGMNYLVCVIFDSCISRTSLNHIYQSNNGYSSHLERIDLTSSYRFSRSMLVHNLMFAISGMLYQFF